LRKSTLLNVVGGLIKPDAGEVLVDGQLVTAPGPERAMVFQNYSLLPRLTLAVEHTAKRCARVSGRSGIDERVDEWSSITSPRWACGHTATSGQARSRVGWRNEPRSPVPSPSGRAHCFWTSRLVRSMP
jgi:ABC-type sugar transport system ATPase subunit